MKSNYKENINSNKILIAPSWNYSNDSFFDKYLFENINYLLDKKKIVILRPHNEHLKRSYNKIRKIKSAFEKIKILNWICQMRIYFHYKIQNY